MSTLEEEKLQGYHSCERDNQGLKKITQRKGDVPRKGAKEVLIEKFESMLQYVPDHNSPHTLWFVQLLVLTGCQ